MSSSSRKSRTGISDAGGHYGALAESAALGDIANAVRAQRQHAGFTQKDLAALANTGVRFIVELEQGKPTLEIGKVLRVLQTLGLEMTLEAIRTLRPIGPVE